jgi:hypothetical protein
MCCMHMPRSFREVHPANVALLPICDGPSMFPHLTADTRSLMQSQLRVRPMTLPHDHQAVQAQLSTGAVRARVAVVIFSSTP